MITVLIFIGLWLFLGACYGVLYSFFTSRKDQCEIYLGRFLKHLCICALLGPFFCIVGTILGVLGYLGFCVIAYVEELLEHRKSLVIFDGVKPPNYRDREDP